MVTLKESLTSQIKVPKISAVEWLTHSVSWPLLDVRSEGEFQEGHIPGSISGPILTNTERHLVGLTYKQKGQEAAIALGLSLVEKFREERVQQWLQSFPKSIAVTCWRGGLRSRFASGWLEKVVGNCRDIVQITGGYKALRRELLKVIEAPREMVVLGGMTGSGKTE
ncbi:MAG: rhodanese-like domain-containing protein, partial [Deltaproteobacteria bacterium]